MLWRAARLRFLGVMLLVVVSVAMLVWMAAGGSAARGRVSTLSLDGGINAFFDHELKQTTYTVPVSDDLAGAKCCSYAWTLTITAPTGQVDPSLGVDPDCDNHGVLSGIGPSFTWQHSNKGDSPRDDNCDHAIYGKYGHQGEISVTVSDDQGWQCFALYKGTLSNDENAALGQQAASTPVCTGPTTEPPPPPLPPPPPPPPPPPGRPCECLSLSLIIDPSSLHLGQITLKDKTYDTVDFTVAWKLRCRPGRVGRSCTGHFNFDAPASDPGQRRYNTRLYYGNSTHGGKFVRCGTVHSCPRIKSGTASFELVLLSGLDRIGRSDETIPIEMTRGCISTGQRVKEFPPRNLSIHFDAKGNIDLAKSKLS